MLALERLVDGFAARLGHGASAGGRWVDAPGVVGLAPGPDGEPARLLVTSDLAVEVLTTRLGTAPSGVVTVLDPATACADLVRALPGVAEKPVTGMVRTDLAALPEPTLHEGLRATRVARPTDDLGADAVGLHDAAGAVARWSPGTGESAERLASHLAGLDGDVALHAAVDDDGVLRATSGTRRLGDHVSVFLVDTDPAWRGLGVARAMSATALRGAAARGAAHASLWSSPQGVRVYLGLGFEIVGAATQFVLPPARPVAGRA